jgi:hypothetical protein
MSDRFTITVGERTFVSSTGRVTTELNKPDSASGTVAAGDLATPGADWAGPAHASVEDDVMHGRVIEAQPQEDGSVVLSLRGATMLDASLLPPMVVQQIDGREIVSWQPARPASPLRTSTSTASKRRWRSSRSGCLHRCWASPCGGR